MLADYEKAGLNELFKIDDNSYLLKPLAKLLSKRLVDIETTDEAFHIILLHSESSTILLNKRILTREILLKYLHKNNVAVTSDFTKSALIEKIQNYWKEKFSLIDKDLAAPLSNDFSTEYSLSNKESVELLAKKFSEWFFIGWNNNTIKQDDFWLNSTLNIRLLDNSGAIEDYHDTTATNIISRIYDIIQKYKFLFNPNTITEKGSIGSIDSHGLVMVLSSGTLHTDGNCVGIFESNFGLVRDINSDNNWKIKSINMLLKSADNSQAAIERNINNELK